MRNLQRCHVIHGSPSHEIPLWYGSNHCSLIYLVRGWPGTLLSRDDGFHPLILLCIAMVERWILHLILCNHRCRVCGFPILHIPY